MLNKNIENIPAEGGLGLFGYKQELKRSLPLSSLVFHGLAVIAGTSVFSYFGIIAQKTHGMTSISYAIAVVAMVFTAFAYIRMSAVYPIAGSVYSYVQRSIDPQVGFLSGWVFQMDYALLPMIAYLLGAIYIQPLFPNVPMWIWMIVLLACVTISNYKGITITAMANNITVIIQYVFIIAFGVACIVYLLKGNGAGTVFDLSGFYNRTEIDAIGWNPILVGASILILSFLGFDSITTIAEEAIQPEKNVGKAILIVCIITGTYFTGYSYLMQLTWPTGWKEFISADSGAWELIVHVTAPWVGVVFTIIYVISVFACAMAATASACRILYSMGRDRSLPAIFAKVHPKYQTPVFAILIITIISLSCLFLSMELAASLINFGALVGFTMVNLSVVWHFFVRLRQRSGIHFLTNLIIPCVGACITYVVWWNLSPQSKLLGFSWLALGLLYLLIKTRLFTLEPPKLVE